MLTVTLLLLSTTITFSQPPSPSSRDYYNGNNVYSISANPYVRIKWPAKSLPTTSNRVEAQILNLSPTLLASGAVQICIQNYLTDLPYNVPQSIQPVLDAQVGNSCSTVTGDHVDKHSNYNTQNYHSAVSYTHLNIDEGREDVMADVNVTVVASLRIHDTITSQATVTFEYTKDRTKTQEYTSIFENPPATLAVEKAFGLGYAEQSRLDPAVLDVDGMSGKKFRHFLNNLVRLTNARSYLEIGVWAGSSFSSAISNNDNLQFAIAIDNFSEYGGPKDIFLNNVNRFKSNPNLQSFLFEVDCWKVDRNVLLSHGPFQVYFFDGPHEQQDHYRAMIEFYEFLADYDAVILVDDWNYVDVRIGTHSALAQLPIDIHYMREIFTSENAPSDVTTDWHNGLGVFVVSKRQAQSGIKLMNTPISHMEL